MRWMPPETSFDAIQTRVRRDILALPAGRAFWLQGFAGTGKTVVLVNLATHIRQSEGSTTPGSDLSLVAIGALRPYARSGRETRAATICFVTFTHALRELLRDGLPDHLRDLPVMIFEEFKKDARNFDWVLVDEVQDLSLDDLALIRKRSGRMILAGDPEQSIYDQGAEPDTISALLSPEVDRLVVTHRLTDKVVRLASCILPTSRIAGAKPSQTWQSRAMDPALRHAPTLATEVAACWTHAREATEPGHPIAILLPSHKTIIEFMLAVCRLEGLSTAPRPRKSKEVNWSRDYAPLNAALEAHGVPLTYLGNGYGSLIRSDEKPLVYIMTYHSAKGLDFDTVILPMLTPKLSIWRDDPAREERLFFVAMTRAKNDLIFSYHGEDKHPLLARLPEHDLHVQSWAEAEQKSEADNDVFF